MVDPQNLEFHVAFRHHKLHFYVVSELEGEVRKQEHPEVQLVSHELVVDVTDSVARSEQFV